MNSCIMYSSLCALQYAASFHSSITTEQQYFTMQLDVGGGSDAQTPPLYLLVVQVP